MDALDQVAGAGADLLSRVDRILARAGAAPDHPVWPPLRRIRALPGEAVGAVAALRPGPLATAGSMLLALAEVYADAGRAAGPDALRSGVEPGRSRVGPGWSGAAAQAYGARAAALSARLAGAKGLPGSSAGSSAGSGLAGRARASAQFADQLAAWVEASRRAVAVAVATALGSAQAVAVRTGQERSPATVLAAADIAAAVLGAVADVYEAGQALCDEWAGRLDDYPDAPPPAAGGGAGSAGAGGVTVPM